MYEGVWPPNPCGPLSMSCTSSVEAIRGGSLSQPLTLQKEPFQWLNNILQDSILLPPVGTDVAHKLLEDAVECFTVSMHTSGCALLPQGCSQGLPMLSVSAVRYYYHNGLDNEC